MPVPYRGLFLRDYLGQTPEMSSGLGWSMSPDIIPNGTRPVANPATFITGYDKEYWEKVTFNVPNYIYIRGKNTFSGKEIARVWFYYTESDLCLWPQNWQENNIQSEGENKNYIEVTAEKQGNIVLTSQAFVWTPPAFHVGNSPGDHYCLIAIVENAPLSDPPQSPKPEGYMHSFDELVEFVRSRPDVAWRNTLDVRGDIPTWEKRHTVTSASAGGLVQIALDWEKMPTDGKFTLIVQGPDPDNSINWIDTPIFQPSGGVNKWLKWPKGWKTSAILTYKRGNTDPPKGATMDLAAEYPSKKSMALGGEAVSGVFPFGRPKKVYAYNSQKEIYVDIIGMIRHQFV